MEDNYRNNDFEEYVKQHADQFRMFPSDKVWNGVHKALHTRRKWYGFGLAFLLLLTGGAVTWVMNTYPVSKKDPYSGISQAELTSAATTSNQHAVNVATPSQVQRLNQAELDRLIPLTGSSQAPAGQLKNGEEDIAASITSRLTRDLTEPGQTATVVDLQVSGPIAQLNVPADVQPVIRPTVALTVAEPAGKTNGTGLARNNVTNSSANAEGNAGGNNAAVNADAAVSKNTVANGTASIATNGISNAASNAAANAASNAAANPVSNAAATTSLASVLNQDKETDLSLLSPDYLATIESIVNSYKAPGKHLSWQFFVTPTISYRRLSQNNSFDEGTGNPLYSGGSNLPFATTPDVNNAVQHKPDVGLQIGFSARYPLTHALRIRGGFQFNINRYDIKAFLNNGEVAHIELNGDNNNTVSTWTNYRSQGGSRLDWLKNYYLSFSAPIGLEVTVFESKNKATSFGLAGTIQPTYVIRDRAYLISTDYKNYAQVPWLIRHVNVNTGFEAFVNYKKGNTEWQIGPQVRYQMLSSFHNKYPVKENLFDFGLKLGVTLNK